MASVDELERRRLRADTQLGPCSVVGADGACGVDRAQIDR
jgi:hypothetical protein